MEIQEWNLMNYYCKTGVMELTDQMAMSYSIRNPPSPVAGQLQFL